MAEIHFKWKNGKETKIAGAFIELNLQKIEEDCKFSCPKHCQKICENKKGFMNEPIHDGFFFTTVMLQLKNISSSTISFLESPPWINLVDSSNRFYQEQQVCQLCEDFINKRYGGTKATKNPKKLSKGKKVDFFLFFPRLSAGTKATALRIESHVGDASPSSAPQKGDVFVAYIVTGEKRRLTLEDFPMEVTNDGDRKPVLTYKSTTSVTPKSENKDYAAQTLSPHLQYRLKQDLSTLPLMRIKPLHETERTKIILPEEMEVLQKAHEEEESEEYIIPYQRRTQRRTYGLAEDRRIFTFREMMDTHYGYCEECENYGALMYFDGLFLCPTCQDLKGHV